MSKMKTVLKKIAIMLVVTLCMSTITIPNNIGIGVQTVEAASSVKINKSSATLIPGQKIQLKVSGTKSKIKWSSTKKSIAIVNSKGKVTAKKKGSCYIIATIGKKQHKCKVTVTELTSFALNKKALSIYAGKGYQLKIAYKPQKVNLSYTDVKWSSSNKSIASVNNKGYIRAYKKGTVYISAKAGKKVVKCKVTVKPAIVKVKSLKMSKTVLNMSTNDYAFLDVDITPSNATNKKVLWSSSNNKVVTVNQYGWVDSKAEGTAYITAKVDGITAKCKVIVKKKPVVSYINNRSVEYYDDEKVERLFWGFLDQDEEVTSGQGKVNIRIENNGENVYKKTFSYSKSDFSNWTNRVDGTRYLCSITIPIDDIKPGKNNNGVIYYQVIDKDGTFDEFSLNIYSIPQKTISVTLPELPTSVLDEVSLYNSITGKYRTGLCNINIQDVKISKDSTSLKVNITGDVTPFIDTVTWTSSHEYKFSLVLMKGDVVMKTYHVYTPKIYLNQKFECSAYFSELDNSEEYSLHITSY